MELNLDWRRETSAKWPDVSYEIRPLKVWAFQELLSFWESHGESDPNEGAAPAAVPSHSVKVIEVAKRIFPDHVRGLAGLTIVQDGEGREATPEGLCEETALLPLAGEIISRLIAVSEIAGNDEKN